MIKNFESLILGILVFGSLVATLTTGSMFKAYDTDDRTTNPKLYWSYVLIILGVSVILFANSILDLF